MKRVLVISREPVDQICPAHFMAVERSTEQTGINHHILVHNIVANVCLIGRTQLRDVLDDLVSQRKDR